jgi:hypothetical protein
MSSPKKLSRITIDIPEEDHKQFKILAAVQGKTMREIILQCIQQSLQDAPSEQKRSHTNS